ncbi:MAG: hypothetical protein OEY80_06990 [Nitrospirota bacterium]|nr:hypothetical protein [Nitrospirota bacterium]MDH4361000.1 hypothetical protein [Nitrospirota bacterium]MDH5575210.1 hypothetical protein [Nitrospirota bacterium]
MKLHSSTLRTRTCSMIAFCSIVMSCALGLAGEPIDGFRDLKFGMTEKEVSALPACRSSTECLYELTDRNRYVELTYLPENTPGTAESPGIPPIPRLAQITIDMGQYTDEWHQQLQIILGKSYRLTHDLTDATMGSFLAKQQDELNTGYEDGQVVLKVVRRPFGNLSLKVVYQNIALAADFIQHMQAAASSPIK